MAGRAAGIGLPNKSSLEVQMRYSDTQKPPQVENNKFFEEGIHLSTSFVIIYYNDCVGI